MQHVRLLQVQQQLPQRHQAEHQLFLQHRHAQQLNQNLQLLHLLVQDQIQFQDLEQQHLHLLGQVV